MFSLTVSDHIMIAHSIRGAEFEPAQGLHGNTLVVEVEFRAPALDELNFLVDVDLAKSELRLILNELDYRNLDDHPALAVGTPRWNSCRATSTAGLRQLAATAGWAVRPGTWRR